MKALTQNRLFGSVLVLLVISLVLCGCTPTSIIEATHTATEEPAATDTSTPVPPTSTPEPPTPTLIPSDTPTPVPIVDYSVETVTLITEDEKNLEGTFFLSEGDIAIVFAHMAGGDNDQENWIPFAKQVARRGFSGLTFNFRCYGESDCGGSGSGSVLSSRDLGAAIDFLNEQGFERIICAGASMGGRGCVNVAFDRELEGLIILSGTGSSDPERQELAEIINPTMPKLFIVSKNDHIADRTEAMTALYESAPEPKIFELFSGDAHGTELFDTRYAQTLREVIYVFLEELR